jgi:hypothetical protein
MGNVRKAEEMLLQVTCSMLFGLKRFVTHNSCILAPSSSWVTSIRILLLLLMCSLYSSKRQAIQALRFHFINGRSTLHLQTGSMEASFSARLDFENFTRYWA